MLKRGAFTVFFSMLLFAISSGWVFGQSVDLKLNLTPGKTYRTRIVGEQKTKTTMMGREMLMNNQQTMDMALAVQSVADGLATVAITFERMVVSLDTPNGKMTFDSDQPAGEQDPNLSMFAALVGSGYTVVADQRGEVKEVRGVREMLDKMFAGIEIPNEQAAAAMKAQLAQAFGEEGSKSTVGQIFGMLPPGAVAVGDSWTKTTDLKVMGLYKTETTYTLKSVSGGKAVLETRAVNDTGDDSEPVDMGMVKVKTDMSGDIEGTLEIDLATGLVSGGSTLMKVTGTRTMSGGQGDMEMPFELEATSTWQPL